MNSLNKICYWSANFCTNKDDKLQRRPNLVYQIGPIRDVTTDTYNDPTDQCSRMVCAPTYPSE